MWFPEENINTTKCCLILTGVFTRGDWSVKQYDRWILTYNAPYHETKLDVENYEQGCFYNISRSDDDRKQCNKYCFGSYSKYLISEEFTFLRRILKF